MFLKAEKAKAWVFPSWGPRSEKAKAWVFPSGNPRSLDTPDTPERGMVLKTAKATAWVFPPWGPQRPNQLNESEEITRMCARKLNPKLNQKIRL